MIVFNKECEERKYSQKVYEENKKWYEDIVNIIQQFEINKIGYAIIKGQALSKQAYGKEGYRNSSDIDFLIDKQNISKVCEILKCSGYIESVYNEFGELRRLTRKEEIIFANSHQTVPFCKILNDGTQINIDLNTDIFWGEYVNKRFCIKDILLTHVKKMEIFEMNLFCLDNVFSFIELCLHHYKDMNAIYTFRYCNPFNLMMFQDVYSLYLRLSLDEKKEIISICKEYDLNDYIYYILYYTNYIYKDSLLFDFLNNFLSENSQEIIDSFGLKDKDKKKWNITFEERFEIENLSEYIEKFLGKREIERIESILSVWG